MVTNTITAIPPKPRVLIADDSKIVRATLIKRIEGLFEFREALDGEEAWETLLIDPNIRVVITDLTMPKLDGYGLLARIRGSKITRIRTIPVVVVSGSDAQEERDRARAAGATDLITKGIGTAQLLSRLEILSKLVNTQQEFERTLEALMRDSEATGFVELATPASLTVQAEAMLSKAIHTNKNFVILNACIGIKHNGLDGTAALPPPSVVAAIGQLLQRTVRQTDCVAVTGQNEFTIATASIQFDSARHFAQRICKAIASAELVKDDRISFIASCGVVSVSEFETTVEGAAPTLTTLCDIARRRARMGLAHCETGVVGPDEEPLFNQGLPRTRIEVVPPQAIVVDAASILSPSDPIPDLGTFLQWIKEGKRDQVMKQMSSLPVELRQMVEMLLKQYHP